MIKVSEKNAVIFCLFCSITKIAQIIMTQSLLCTYYKLIFINGKHCTVVYISKHSIFKYTDTLEYTIIHSNAFECSTH